MGWEEVIKKENDERAAAAIHKLKNINLRELESVLTGKEFSDPEMLEEFDPDYPDNDLTHRLESWKKIGEPYLSQEQASNFVNKLKENVEQRKYFSQLDLLGGTCKELNFNEHESELCFEMFSDFYVIYHWHEGESDLYTKIDSLDDLVEKIQEAIGEPEEEMPVVEKGPPEYWTDVEKSNYWAQEEFYRKSPKDMSKEEVQRWFLCFFKAADYNTAVWLKRKTGLEPIINNEAKKAVQEGYISCFKYVFVDSAAKMKKFFGIAPIIDDCAKEAIQQGYIRCFKGDIEGGDINAALLQEFTGVEPDKEIAAEYPSSYKIFKENLSDEKKKLERKRVLEDN